jgi:hypothetical protein
MFYFHKTGDAMIKSRRKNYQLGGSKAVTYPSGIIVGEEASIAGNRLLLIDPRGEIGEDELLEFMEKHVEPAFWSWWEGRKRSLPAPERGGVRPMDAEGLVAAQEIRPAEAQAIAPGTQVFLVNCTRCGGQIAWRTDWGLDGTCPYCGILLRLMV